VICPLGYNGSSQETKTLPWSRETAFTLAGGPGTAIKVK